MDSGLLKWSAELEGVIDDALDVVGETIRNFEDNTAKGTFGDLLKAVDTGNMSGSYNFDRPTKTSVRNGNPVEYTIYVELGTNKMRPRPIMQWAIEYLPDEINDIVTRAINAV